MQSPSLSRADIVALTIVTMLIALLVPTAFAQEEARNKELDNRRACATNLQGLGAALNVYAADNSDAFPTLPTSSATTYDVAMKRGVGTTVEETLKDLYKNGTNNPLQQLWILVLRGDVGPKNFLCKSDPFANTPAAEKQLGAFGSDLFWGDFQDSKNCSYSVIYPWTVDKNKKIVTYKAWSALIDSSLPIMSDMAPYLGKKGKPEEAATRPAESKPDAPMDEEWAVKKANAQNHQFEGQNVLYSDAHAEFNRSPAVGEDGDSIWGMRKSEEQDPKDATEVAIEAGTLPHPPNGSMGNFDVTMVPMRDAKGNWK